MGVAEALDDKCSLIRVDLEEGDLLDSAVRKRFMIFWLHIFRKPLVEVVGKSMGGFKTLVVIL